MGGEIPVVEKMMEEDEAVAGVLNEDEVIVFNKMILNLMFNLISIIIIVFYYNL
jgi:hypothetical protein